MPPPRSWPRAIVHVDGDAFFVACEQAVNPKLRGKPVVVGKDRNIIAAASYEAKALGIARGVPLWEAKRKYPDLIVLSSNYELYSRMSEQLMTIIRRYTPTVEEYSVDEAFADITGLRRLHHGSYPEIARRLQTDIHQTLGITVSIGVSLTKTLAKTASHYHKPAGCTAISGKDIPEFLTDLPVGHIWNVGPNTAALLHQHGIQTALEFIEQSAHLIEQILTKPGIELWQELKGQQQWSVNPAPKTSQQSISKIRTFTPPSDDAAYLYAQLMRNVENACHKARCYGQAPQRIGVVLRQHDFRSVAADVRLRRPSAYPHELAPVVQELFTALMRPGKLYRATQIVLADLVMQSSTQRSLFEAPLAITKTRRLYDALDYLRDKYGPHAIHQATSTTARQSRSITTFSEQPVNTPGVFT